MTACTCRGQFVDESLGVKGKRRTTPPMGFFRVRHAVELIASEMITVHRQDDCSITKLLEQLAAERTFSRPGRTSDPEPELFVFAEAIRPCLEKAGKIVAVSRSTHVVFGSVRRSSRAVGWDLRLRTTHPQAAFV